jgi:transposase
MLPVEEESVVAVTLSGDERVMLERLLTERVDARVVRRGQALVWLDDGDSVEEIADRLFVSRQCIYNWLARFESRKGEELLIRLGDAARTGRPPTATGIIDPLIDAVIDHDPRQLGYRQTVWTAALLRRYLEQVHHVEVSKRSIHRAIARLDIAWKLPRHTLAHREWYWRQAKGASNVGSGRASARSS